MHKCACLYKCECVCVFLVKGTVHTDTAVNATATTYALVEFISVKNRHRVPKQYQSWCRVEGVGRVRERESHGCPYLYLC